MSRSCVVYKLGGSLLELPDLGERLLTILSEDTEALPVLIVGGGAAADIVRRWDGIHRLTPEAAHRLAIEAMEFNAAVVRELLTRHGLSVTLGIEDAAPGSVCVPDMPAQLSFAAPAVPPAAWEVTSDTLAVWLAGGWGVSRVVFLKSVDLPGGATLQAAVESGACDPMVPHYVRPDMRLEWINLRRSPQQRSAVAFPNEPRGSDSMLRNGAGDHVER